MRYFLSILVFLFVLSCSTAFLALDAVEEFSIEKYSGEWYELYRLPNRFQEGLTEVTTLYELNEDGTILVVTEGRLKEDRSRLTQAKGRVWAPNESEKSKLRLSYSWSFSSDYWVLKVDPTYDHALIGEPSGKYLWILSRDRRGDPKVIEEFKRYAAMLGFPIEKLIDSQLY